VNAEAERDPTLSGVAARFNCNDNMVVVNTAYHTYVKLLLHWDPAVQTHPWRTWRPR